MDTTTEQIANAPLPLKKELNKRKNMFKQFAKFVGISWTMFWLAKRH